MKLTVYTDGGSRGNPGPSATGIVIKDKKGEVVAAYGEYLGKQTNNFAEYSAVISALKKCRELGADEVQVISDSKLVVEQMNQNWKVRDPDIQKVFVKAWNAMQRIKKVRITHIRREGNKEADAEVNKVLDARK